MHRVIYYTTARGDCPVKEFMEELPRKAAEKTAVFIQYLAEKGPMLHRPYTDHVRGSIRELRVQFARNAVRVLFFFMVKGDIVLVHGFLKKDMALRESDIRLAEERMKDWLLRQGGH
jgi:phage-related protein